MNPLDQYTLIEQLCIFNRAVMFTLIEQSCIFVTEHANALIFVSRVSQIYLGMTLLFGEEYRTLLLWHACYAY